MNIHIVVYYIILYYVMSCHAMPCHIISYHIMPESVSQEWEGDSIRFGVRVAPYLREAGDSASEVNDRIGDPLSSPQERSVELPQVWSGLS